VHDKDDKLNQPMHTAGHVLSPSSCTHFSPSIMKSHHEMTHNIIFFHWTHFIILLKCYISPLLLNN